MKKEEMAAIKYFQKKGWEIEVWGEFKRDAFVIDFAIGGISFPESLIKSGTSIFAIIPKDKFEKLERSGVITEVVEKKFISFGNEFPGKVGKGDVEVKGRVGEKSYRSVSIAGIKFQPKFQWGAILGNEFVASFGACEMGWPGDPVVGFFGCRKIRP